MDAPERTSKDFPACFHRVSIKGLCVRDGKVLLSRESEKLGGSWELPGGGLEFGEDIQESFKREIEEESGLRVSKMSDRPIYAFTTRIEKWRGMEWYYTLILAYRVEFDDASFRPTDECLETRFFSKEELEAIDFSQTNPQTESFKKIFDPADFEEGF